MQVTLVGGKLKKGKKPLYEPYRLEKTAEQFSVNNVY